MYFSVIAKIPLDGFGIQGMISLLIMKINEIEIAHLVLRYAHTRIIDGNAVGRLAGSLQRHGQVTPVLVVNGASPQFVLIDGYLRTQAIRRIGRDTIKAQIWNGGEIDALVHVLAKTQDRRWDPLEQAALIRELNQKHDLSHEKIAALMGKDQSWVSRRLMLINDLPEDVIDWVQKGHISSWSAGRVLAPMARAMPEHARTIAKYLVKNPLSTRKLDEFFSYYRKSNRKVRARMVEAPELFFKSLASKQAQKHAKELQAGPEGRWLKDIRIVGHIIGRLIRDLPVVFYPGQDEADRLNLLGTFERSRNRFQELAHKIERSGANEQTGNQRDYFESASPVGSHSPDQPSGESVPQYGSPYYPQTGSIAG